MDKDEAKKKDIDRERNHSLYVTGSDIYGPMGRELIPFENGSDAREFMKDHKGKSILQFRQITYETVKAID